MSYTYKVSSTNIWHNTSGNDINRIMRERGTNAHAVFSLNDDSVESNLAYIAAKYDDSGLIHYFVITDIEVLPDVEPTTDNDNLPAVCAWLNTTNGVKIKIGDANIGSAQNNVVFNGYYSRYINGTWTREEFVGATEVGFPLPDGTLEGEVIVNFNNPFIPVFTADSGAATDKVSQFLNHPDRDMDINYRSKNYYDPTLYSQPINVQSDYFKKLQKSLQNYINLCSNSNIKSRQEFVDKILKPMNDLIIGYKKNRFKEKISELKEEIEENTKNFLSYKNLNIIEKPTVLRGQVTFPSSAPYIPYYSYSPLKVDDMNVIDSFVKENCQTSFSHAVSDIRPYFLILDSISGSSESPIYTIRAIQTNNETVTVDGEKLANIQITSNSEMKDSKFYFEYNNVDMKLTNYDANSFSHATFTYQVVNGERTCANWTVDSGQEINLYHGNTISLDEINPHVPFYCSHDVNVTYIKENGDKSTPLSYTWLKRDESLDPYREEGSSAEYTPAGMILIKPVALFYNRYERAFINQWDGNKLKIADGYLIAPQVGAGKKENGLFTGIFMGVSQTKPNISKDYRVGLFGEHQGIQTLFINAADGSAIFGKNGAGQIIIDPQTNKGMLYSNNYWKDYKSDGKPLNYNQTNLNRQGMLIDLSTPEIRFGNGNFVVDKNGNVTIAGGGGISGWEIGDTQIHSRTSPSQGRMVLDSGVVKVGTDENGVGVYNVVRYGRIYTGRHDEFDKTQQGFYLSDEGLSIGSSIRISSASDGKIQVGRLSSQGKYWTIDGNTSNAFIGYNATNFDCSNLDDPVNYSIGGLANSVYMGTNGIRLGQKFAVDSDGNIVAKQAVIEGTINVLGNGQSKIGTWQVNTDNLYNYYQDGAYYYDICIGANGNLYSRKWNGIPESPGATYTVNWAIDTEGKAYFSDLDATVPSGKTMDIAGSLTVGGTATVTGSLTAGGVTLSNSGINADEGTIGGFTISTSGIGSSTGGNAYMSSNNMGAANGWFSNLYVNNSKFISTNTQVVTDVWTDATGIHCDYTTIQYLGLTSS